MTAPAVLQLLPKRRFALRKPLDEAANAVTSRQSAGKLSAGCATSVRNLLSQAANGVSCRLSG